MFSCCARQPVHQVNNFPVEENNNNELLLDPAATQSCFARLVSCCFPCLRQSTPENRLAQVDETSVGGPTTVVAAVKKIQGYYGKLHPAKAAALLAHHPIGTFAIVKNPMAGQPEYKIFCAGPEARVESAFVNARGIIVNEQNQPRSNGRGGSLRLGGNYNRWNIARSFNNEQYHFNIDFNLHKVESLPAVETLECFIPGLTKDRAEELLRDRTPGSYLIRNSASQNNRYTLSFVAADDTIQHCGDITPDGKRQLLINDQQHLFDLYSEQQQGIADLLSGEELFSNLAIEARPHSLAQDQIKPVAVIEFSPGFFSCNKTEAEELLRGRAPGTYLIRPASTGGYAISYVKLDGSINHACGGIQASGVWTEGSTQLSYDLSHPGWLAPVLNTISKGSGEIAVEQFQPFKPKAENESEV